MHLKLGNHSVASVLYTRLISQPSLPQREKEVVLRKLAVCATTR